MTMRLNWKIVLLFCVGISGILAMTYLLTNPSGVQNIQSRANIAAHEDLDYVPDQLPQQYFGAPLHGELTLSGTFAELRSNHFHSGLDFRTGGREGLSVLASADGYVSRIRISPYGFGKALYIAHPNGYTTVYGHVKDFNGFIQDFAIRKQYETQSFDQELYLLPTDLRVKKGDTIAWSGNTGGSGGPHLHFEIRKSSNDQIINPLFFGIKVKDNIEPFIKSILLVHIQENTANQVGYYPERLSRQAPPLKKSKEVLQLPPGKYGLALSGVDYFTDFASRLGINYSKLYVNDRLIFSQDIEHYLFEETRYINAHLDYAFLREKGVRYARLFNTPFNKLKFNRAIDNGIFHVIAGDTLTIKAVVTDHVGLKDSLVFRVHGNVTAKLSAAKPTEYIQYWKVKGNAENKLDMGSFRAVASPGSILANAQIGYEPRTAPAGALSALHCLYGAKIPLFRAMQVSLKPEKTIADPTKFVVIYKDPATGWIQCENGKYANGWVTTSTKNIGFYYLMADSTKPAVVPHALGRNLRFRISDNLSGISGWNCTVNGQWILLEYDYKSGNLWGNIPKSIAAGKHALELIVKDKSGNTNIIKRNIQI